MDKLTVRDWAHLREVWEGNSQDPEVCAYWDGGEAVMTSIGYVDLWPDGDVTGYGRKLGNIQDQEVCDE